MAGDRRPFDEDDMASLYLRRMRGDEGTAAGVPETPAEPSRASLPGAAPLPGETARPAFPGAAPASDEPQAFAFGAPVRPAPQAAPAVPLERDTPLPPGAPLGNKPNLSVQPGDLPIWMASDGLQMLRLADYTGAAEYYEREVRHDEARAEGWLGIGAALYGSSEFRKAVPYLLKGAQIDTTFPVGALLYESRPGQPQLLLNMAELLLAEKTPVSTRVALDVLDECMRNPTTPQKVYLRANEMRDEARDQVEALKSPDLSRRRGRRIRKSPLAGPLRLLITIVVLAGLGYAGWYGWRYFEGMRLVRDGFSDFKAAAQMSTTGMTPMSSSADVSDPAELYYRAFSDFTRAQNRPGVNAFQVQFMIVRSGDAVLERVRERPTLSRTIGEKEVAIVERSVRQSRVRIARLDPTGARLREQQAELSALLATK